MTTQELSNKLTSSLKNFIKDLGDCVFFYSGDGGTVYTVDSRFVRVSSTYGGTPLAGLQKSAGTTNRVVDMDYMALSKKGGVI